jgi:hypothetical protein
MQELQEGMHDEKDKFCEQTCGPEARLIQQWSYSLAHSQTSSQVTISLWKRRSADFLSEAHSKPPGSGRAATRALLQSMLEWE